MIRRVPRNPFNSKTAMCMPNGGPAKGRMDHKTLGIPTHLASDSLVFPGGPDVCRAGRCLGAEHPDGRGRLARYLLFILTNHAFAS